MPYMIKVMCAVCNTIYEEREVKKDPQGLWSHGMCPLCGPKWHEEQMEEVKEMLKRGGEDDV